MQPCSYRLPYAVQDRLTAALKPRRNRDACLALASFLGRFWSAPRKLGLPFAIDRRALACIEALGLTEARIRGALASLEHVGFLERHPDGGRTHQRTEQGLHRRPIRFAFGAAFRVLFEAANRRAQTAQERWSQAARARVPVPPPRPSAGFLEARPAISPKSKSSAAAQVYLGGQPSRPPDPTLEAALERWRTAFEDSRRGARTVPRKESL